MNIAILSLPLNWNCGGILQQYALQRQLEILGNQVTIISRRRNQENPLLRWAVGAKWKSIEHLGKIKALRNRPEFAVSSFKRLRLENRTEDLFSTQALRRCFETREFDAVVVGSDQVWNPDCAPNLLNYFLDFIEDNTTIRKIAYAASFGHEQWRINQEDGQRCAELVRLFDGISVREASAVTLCKQHFRTAAEHMPDPTILLEPDEYSKLVPSNLLHEYKFLFAYLLDLSPQKLEVIYQIAKLVGLEPRFFYKPRTLSESEFNTSHPDLVDRGSRGYVPSIEAWIQSIRSSNFVVTDSFHGTVFAILYNRPFISIVNQARGAARFHSLLDVLGLQNRLVVDAETAVRIANEDIDWCNVNEKLSSHRGKGVKFLSRLLCTE